MKTPRDLREILDHLSIPVLLIDRSYAVIEMNRAARAQLAERGGAPGRPCFQLTHGLDEPCWKADGTDCPLKRAFESRERVRTIHQHERGSNVIIEEIVATPVRDEAGEVAYVIEEFRDVTALLELRDGILPICAGCKKIRDPSGSWHSVESYLARHTGAGFSHSFCDDCFDALDLELDPEG